MDMLVNSNQTEFKTKAYACYNKDIEVRMSSTSGGVFSLIAEYMIQVLNGYVCGAVFDDEFNVKHILTNQLEVVSRMRGSKYPQSSIGDCFKDIKTLLDKGTYVLFVGTPCQAYGLLCFLKHDYKNLITMDFVCHGVASNKIWQDYLELFSNKKELIGFRFKDKIKGWKTWHVMKQYSSTTNYKYGLIDIFMRSYLSGINHRPSCFTCPIKGIQRKTDFTVADCWGEGEKNKRLNDDKGLSALLVHNCKAYTIFQKIVDQLEFQEYNAELLMQKNWACTSSSAMPANRKAFFEEYRNSDLKDRKRILKRYFGIKWNQIPSIIKKKALGKIK